MRSHNLQISRGLAVVLLSAFLCQGLILISRTSPTADEVAFNMVNGYTYLKTHDYRMSPANPALIREWMAWPWLFLNPTLDLNKKSWKEADSVPFAKEFFYQDNGPLAEKLLFISRFMILLLGLAMGVVVYVWSRELYGEWAGALALAFYAFCPNVLAYSSIAGTDIGVAFFCTLAAYCLWRYLEYSKPKDRWFFIFSLAFACAAKFNALILGPVFLLVLGIKKGWLEFLSTAIFLALATFFIIWASYGFECKIMLAGGVPRVEEKMGYLSNISHILFPQSQMLQHRFETFVKETPLPIPSYLLGMAGVARSHSAEYLHYAFGQWTTDTQWYYYLFSFAVKMTLPFLLLLMVRISFFKKYSSSHGHENLVILLPVGVVLLTTFGDSTAVGIRYLLPIIPMLFVWISGLANQLKPSNFRTTRDGLLYTAIALNILWTVSVFPYYLSYFNPLVGGVRGGYHYVRGSDVDWGQGLKDLAVYLKKNNIEQVSTELFSFADPAYYKISSIPMTEEERVTPLPKVYAVSLFHLEHVKWHDRFKPTLVGGCIFVYDLRSEGMP